MCFSFYVCVGIISDISAVLRDVLAGFKKRNKITLRKPSKLTTVRARQSKPEIIQEFYDKLLDAFTQHHYTAAQIFNLDETGVYMRVHVCVIISFFLCCILFACTCVYVCLFVFLLM